MKKVLVFYLNPRSGHHVAGLAVRESLQRADPNASIRLLDSLPAMHPVLQKILLNTYMGVVQKTPEIWDYLYDNRKVKERLSRIREAMHRKKLSKLKRLLEDFQPDAVICTQAYPCGVISTFKEVTGWNIPLVAVATDYVIHSYWIMEGVDNYIVPTVEGRDKLLREGIPPKKIRVYGIPVFSRFQGDSDRESTRRLLGIGPKTTAILVMGGGHGLLPMKRIVQKMKPLGREVHLIALTGANSLLYEKLVSMKKRGMSNLTVLGNTNEVDKLMAASDMLVTKPGGVTVTEAIIKRLPMLIMDPLPGQETKNLEFIVNKGIAIAVDEPRDLPSTVQHLLDNPFRLEEMKRAMVPLRRPDSAEKIARLVLDDVRIVSRPAQNVPVPVL